MHILPSQYALSNSITVLLLLGLPRDRIGNNSLPSFRQGLLAPLTEKGSDHAHFGKHVHG